MIVPFGFHFFQRANDLLKGLKTTTALK